jgi:hypothetical protein
METENSLGLIPSLNDPMGPNASQARLIRLQPTRQEEALFTTAERFGTIPYNGFSI